MPLLTAYIGLGSNLGDRAAHFRAAETHLERILTNIRVSTAIASIAVDRNGLPDSSEPSYLNAAARGIFAGTPHELLDALRHIEIELGRDPREKSQYLPRAIDLDILYLEAGGIPIVVNDPDLVVPHPRLAERPFYLEPLRELGLDYLSLMDNQTRRHGDTEKSGIDGSKTE